MTEDEWLERFTKYKQVLAPELANLSGASSEELARWADEHPGHGKLLLDYLADRHHWYLLAAKSREERDWVLTFIRLMEEMPSETVAAVRQIIADLLSLFKVSRRKSAQGGTSDGDEEE